MPRSLTAAIDDIRLSVVRQGLLVCIHPSILSLPHPLPTLLTMKSISYLVSALLATVAVASPTPELEERATTWCGAFGSVTTNGKTVYHNNWGSGDATSGSQCTTFTGVSSNSFVWSTSWTWVGGPGKVKSYSNVALEKTNKPLSAISSIPSTWTWRYANPHLYTTLSQTNPIQDTPEPT